MKTREGQLAKELTPKTRAMVSLGLDSEPIPVIREALKAAKIKEWDALTLLRCSIAPEAVSMIRAYDSLAPAERKAVKLDWLMSAAKDVDGNAVTPARILGIITEQMFIRSTSITGMIAAASAPKVMESAVAFAHTPNGHADRKMLLQSTGNAPVPKNQSTYVNISGNKIDKSIHISSTPTLESVLTSPDMSDLDKIIDAE